MTFTSRSSECGLLRVRASSNKWAVWRVLGRKDSWEVVRGSECMVISSFGQFSGRLTPLITASIASQWPCINIITQRGFVKLWPLRLRRKALWKKVVVTTLRRFYFKRSNTQGERGANDWLTSYATSCKSIAAARLQCHEWNSNYITFKQSIVRSTSTDMHHRTGMLVLPLSRLNNIILFGEWHVCGNHNLT